MTSTPAIPDQNHATLELYKSVIGPINQSYYLRVFAHFDAKGKTGILWHWPAFFSTLNWLVFRKMWGMAAWFAGLSLVYSLAVFGIGKLMFGYSETTEGILIGLSLLLVFVLPGLFANAAYYRFCERTINGVLVDGVGVPTACDTLAKRASSRKRFLVLAILNLVTLAILATMVTWVTGADLDGKARSLTTDLPAELTPGAAAVKPPTIATSTSVVASASMPASAPAAPAASVPAVAKEISAQPDEQAATAAKLPSAQGASMPVASFPLASAPASAPTPSPAMPTLGSSVAPPVAQQYFIQVGAFANLQNARKTMTQLETMGFDADAAPVVVRDGRLTRIRVGPFKSRTEARKAADQIKAQGLPALLVKL